MHLHHASDFIAMRPPPTAHTVGDRKEACAIILVASLVASPSRLCLLSLLLIHSGQVGAARCRRCGHRRPFVGAGITRRW